MIAGSFVEKTAAVLRSCEGLKEETLLTKCQKGGAWQNAGWVELACMPHKRPMQVFETRVMRFADNSYF